MALNLDQKKEVVAELANVAAKAHSLVAAEYAGLSVSQLTDLRVKARQGKVYLRVAKNTLVSRAVAGTEFECVKDSLRVLAGRPRRCRPSDQGFCQGE